VRFCQIQVRANAIVKPYSKRLDWIGARPDEVLSDQLTAQVDQLEEHSRHADEGAEHMALFIGLILNLDDAVAAKQSVAFVMG
jgi:hypothetical protein